MEITSLCLPYETERQLLSLGFVFVDEITHTELSNRSSLSEEQIIDLLERIKELIKPPEYPYFINSLQLLNKECKMNKLSTNSTDIDDLFDGGLPFGRIMEVCGGPGTGKTQICHQLCISHLPDKSLFIDSEGTFSTDRLRDMANFRNLEVDFVLENILVSSCTSFKDLIQILSLLVSSDGIKLLVIDSLSMIMSLDSDKSRNLSILADRLVNLCISTDMAIVVSNWDVRRTVDGISCTIPALGETWRRSVCYRIMLSNLSVNSPTVRRMCVLDKAPEGRRSEGKVFTITDRGIQDD